MKFRPLHDRVMIRRVGAEEKKDGVIVASGIELSGKFGNMGAQRLMQRHG